MRSIDFSMLLFCNFYLVKTGIYLVLWIKIYVVYMFDFDGFVFFKKIS